jgi:hypothetical protein
VTCTLEEIIVEIDKRLTMRLPADFGAVIQRSRRKSAKQRLHYFGSLKERATGENPAVTNPRTHSQKIGFELGHKWEGISRASNEWTGCSLGNINDSASDTIRAEREDELPSLFAKGLVFHGNFTEISFDSALSHSYNAIIIRW